MDERLRKQVISEIKEIFELSKNVVHEEKEPFRTEAFKIIFSELIKNSVAGQEDPSSIKKNGNKERIPPDKKKIELAKLCSLSAEEVDDVFSIRENSIKIIAPINGNESFKRKIASQCYLVAAEIILEKDWVESKELAEVLRDIGVKDLSNLAPQLKKNKEIFRIDSKRGNNKYKLTSGIGRTKACEIIHKLAKGEPIED
jgi:hypothetical protein